MSASKHESILEKFDQAQEELVLQPADLSLRTIANMVAKAKWEGRWDQLKGKARQAWGELTDDDLDVAEGQWDEFVGRIKERTGEGTESIEAALRDDS